MNLGHGDSHIFGKYCLILFYDLGPGHSRANSNISSFWRGQKLAKNFPSYKFLQRWEHKHY